MARLYIKKRDYKMEILCSRIMNLGFFMENSFFELDEIINTKVNSEIVPQSLKKFYEQESTNPDQIVYVTWPKFNIWEEFGQEIFNGFKIDKYVSLMTIYAQTAEAKFMPTNRDFLEKLYKDPQLAYSTKLNCLKRLFVHLWLHARHNECFKIVRELANVIGECKNPIFYPIQVMLITDVLDLCGFLLQEYVTKRLDEINQNEDKQIRKKQLEKLKNSYSAWYNCATCLSPMAARIYISAVMMPILYVLNKGDFEELLYTICWDLEHMKCPIVSSYAIAYLLLNVVFRCGRQKFSRCCKNVLKKIKQTDDSKVTWPVMQFISKYSQFLECNSKKSLIRVSKLFPTNYLQNLKKPIDQKTKFFSFYQ